MTESDKETKILIANKFIHLAASDPHRKISVSSLAEECHINRNTFYLYFDDIRDLMRWSCKYKANEILTEMRRKDTPIEKVDCLKISDENYLSLFRYVFFNLGLTELKRLLALDYDQLLKEYMKAVETYENLDIDPVYFDFLCEQCNDSIVKTMLYGENDTGENIRKKMRYAQIFMKYALPKMMRHSSDIFDDIS